MFHGQTFIVFILFQIFAVHSDIGSLCYLVMVHEMSYEFQKRIRKAHHQGQSYFVLPKRNLSWIYSMICLKLGIYLGFIYSKICLKLDVI